MKEIVKHINDTNASYRNLSAGDAKNTDLFLDNDHYELFRDCGELITVRLNKENLTKAILFICSILPRKFDQSTTHKIIHISTDFVYDQLAILDAFFTKDGQKVDSITQVWNARKDVLKRNGEVDKRFYFNGLLQDISYIDHNGNAQNDKFTIRNYLAGGYSQLLIKKSEDNIFDITIENVTTPYNDEKEIGPKEDALLNDLPHQQIFYGAPGTGKSHGVERAVKRHGMTAIRTTFHPDSDYSTFVGAYKPQMEAVVLRDYRGEPVQKDGSEISEKRIVYKFTQQAFLKAYIAAWKNLRRPHVLVIEEINRGNCAQIFGDLFQLLDRDEAGFSKYPIEADTDIKEALEEAFKGLQKTDIAVLHGDTTADDITSGQRLVLPNNLYIWATMNTSDQSLFPIDSAFKRRWEWKYVPISDAGMGWRIAADDAEYDWWSFVERINDKIWDATQSEDKKLGYFFCKADRKRHGGDTENTIISANRFVGKVLFYLYNDVFKNYCFDDDTFQDLPFQSYFKPDGSPQEETVAAFLKRLGVAEIRPADNNGGNKTAED